MQTLLLGFIAVVYRRFVYTGIQNNLLDIYLGYSTKLPEHRPESYLKSVCILMARSLNKVETSHLGYISCWPELQMFCVLSIIPISRAFNNWREL